MVIQKYSVQNQFGTLIHACFVLVFFWRPQLIFFLESFLKLNVGELIL
jgi:hypothetical protein